MQSRPADGREEDLPRMVISDPLGATLRCIAALLAFTTTASPQDANDVLKRVSDALGWTTRSTPCKLSASKGRSTARR